MGQPRADLEYTQFYPRVVDCTVTIATDDTTSAAVDLDGTHLYAFRTPGTLTSTSVWFQESYDGDDANFSSIYDDTNTLVSYTVAAGRVYALNPEQFAAFRHLRMVTGASEAADRTFKLYTRS